ncbi:hypothetical protein TPL01_28250 [Sulfuriferula plumbiphila]|uniref:Uncharacterized protein n=1 Tax=Sulfuriferula plumbiphila TaxID=171865 RepID=A0A512LB35_9PROT|nr:hypothetical protein [Sulfuriferula plumbiphila]BBP04303.1 hypothetical protein SFPGR_17250 [Sulfuriferula plumbiphila]GEP31687.1 hypothetical protein TPL01_28250 [Sulfuriferula plumbiphila]
MDFSVHRYRKAEPVTYDASMLILGVLFGLVDPHMRHMRQHFPFEIFLDRFAQRHILIVTPGRVQTHG